ncbi:MAG: stress response translation initiation inhibitor YciH [Gammaproteobacteria bacterium]|jgi:translation initiation factor 1|nr:stress response translation initiation inhibitor YciH [Gammaproteobacteria bacterium]
MNKNSTRVYSTETGSLCSTCGSKLSACKCQKFTASFTSGDGKIRVSRESKGRKGNGVSLISGLPLSEAELKTLAKKLKQICGSGGAVKQGIIEIQGEHRDRLVIELSKLGYSAIKAGG